MLDVQRQSKYRSALGKYDEAITSKDAVRSRRMQMKVMADIKRNRYDSMTNLGNQLPVLLPVQEAYQVDNS